MNRCMGEGRYEHVVGVVHIGVHVCEVRNFRWNGNSLNDLSQLKSDLVSLKMNIWSKTEVIENFLLLTSE